MADNPPPTPPPNSGLKPTLPATGLTGRLPSALRKPGAGKIVVMLSSVAKAPPAGTQSLPRVTPAAGAQVAPLPTIAPPAAPPKVTPPATPPPTEVPGIVLRPPPPLPPKQVAPAAKAPVEASKLSTTTYVKLPPKTSVPQLTSLSGITVPAPVAKAAPTGTVAPPSLPPKSPEPKKSGAQHIPPIKLNELSSPAEPASESIFLKADPVTTAPKPVAAPKTPEPLVLQPPVLAKAPEPALVKPPPLTPPIPAPIARPPEIPSAPTPPPTPPPTPTPAPEAKEKPAPVVVPPPISPTLPPVVPPPVALKPPVRPPPLPPPVAKPAESIPAPISTLHVAPPMLEKTPEPVAEKLPQPHLPPPVPIEARKEEALPASAPLHVAPPMLEKAPEPISEKLPQPHLSPLVPIEARKADVPSALPEAPGIHKVPAMIQPEMPALTQPSPVSTTKPLAPPNKPKKKGFGSWLKKSTPLVVSSTSKVQPPPVAEAKPALKPPTLPKRALPNPDDSFVETPPPLPGMPKIDDEVKPPEKSVLPPPTTSVTPPEPVKVTLPKGDDLGASVVVPALTGAAAAIIISDKSKRIGKPDKAAKPEKPDKKTEESTPLTRAERAKRRRLVGTILFYVFMLATLAVLYVGSLYVGRETRIEGQVIPPEGMTLNNEVWLVSGRELWTEASGVADDLARERAPLLQEIQERQDHVQRAQADVASREERIRLINEQIQAAKDDITNTVKQARDATQQIWDVDGAEIDQEYTAHLNDLQRTIAARAKSLNLNYQPDPNFPSPEVWANAYRLALYGVPATIDSVKEHQWLSDQMKQWRDYEKSLDDRKEQLRDKAAQVKLAPAPHINDLNTKIDELQQRVDSTAAEEVPLKAELQQAQADLVNAQATEAGLDDKYYKQLYARPDAATTKRIPLAGNGRFSWVDDNPFSEGEPEHHYWMFFRATRADGRQYWLLTPFSIERYHKWCFLVEPDGFISTKAILRPNLSPEEQAE